MDTFFNALKTCFQAYHVFCVDYLPASEHLWLILQKAFFGFTVNEETSLSNVETVIKSLSVLLGNSDGPSDKDTNESDEDKSESGVANAAHGPLHPPASAACFPLARGPLAEMQPRWAQ
ncbi:hypothetical protein QAD02_007712 [Eretmocerus hayati]|uniref:Uncharacterized protein n=1 Tax=Eretmocerus hayati TaxID=131215 RepID=A0ACC2N4E7_9HYME|nr:hypothetical protein QAD02_007712 [Eretmocerus hayati]